MERNLIETAIGALILLVAGGFLLFAYNTAHLNQEKGYPIRVRFSKVGGLQPGADVRIVGVKVGSVAKEKLDPTTFHAVVDLSIFPSVRLPVDTRASIVSDGLLGGTYVRLDPGTSVQMLKAGEAILRVHDYRSLEDVVGEMIFSLTRPSAPETSPSSPSPPDPRDADNR